MMKTYTVETNGFHPETVTPAKSQHHQSILLKLRSIVANLLKSEPEEVDIYAPFLEMGADSIVLVEAIHNFEKTFGIKISIRQLFEELTTIDALANYIEQNTTPELTIQTDVVQPQAQTNFSLRVNDVDTTASESLLEEIINQQMQLMSEQLEVLQSYDLTVKNSLNNNSLNNSFLSQNDRSQSQSQIQGNGIISSEKSEKTASSKLNSKKSNPKKSNPKKSNPKKSNSKKSSAISFYKPAEIRARGLTPQQSEHLEELITRYNQRTKTSKQLTNNYRPTLADNRASVGFRFSTKEMLYPIVGDRSQGARMWDVDGNEYIDISMGFGVNLFGHNPEFITTAIANQLKLGMQLGPQTSLAGEVARLICELTGLERACFCNSGTEAVMTALRLARTATKRNKVAMFAGSFHGSFDATLAMATPENDNSAAQPIAPGIVPTMVEDTLVLDYDDPQSLEIIRAHAHELAAVLVEPVQSRRPDLQPRKFLQKLRQLTQETGIVLILDEMITGFRIHSRGAQEWFGIDADIATYGKIVGGGMPIGVVAGKAAYMDGIDGGMWNYGDASYPQADTTFFAGTFCKHPLVMAAARAVLQEIKWRGKSLQEELNQRTAKLAATLNAYFEAENLPIQIVHFGSLFRFASAENVDLLFYHLLCKGIYIWEGRNCFLSAAHTDEDVNSFVDAIKESIKELRTGGFFLKPSSMTPSEGGKQSEVIPLTTAQKQLWILAQMEDDASLAYNVTANIELQGSFNLEAMERSVQQVVARHQALRTTISKEGDTQEISSSLQIDVPLIDFSEVEADKVNQRLQSESLKPFDLSRGPLLRVRILKLGTQLHRLVLTVHHVIADGWSMGVILQDLASFYSSECQGVAATLPLPMQYGVYIRHQQQHGKTPEMAEHEAYWEEKFADSIPVLDLPTDRPRPPVKTYKGSRQTLHLDGNLYREVKDLARQNGSTLFMTLLAAYTALLYRLTEQGDIVVGIPASGRLQPGSEGMVGYCSHLLPIRSSILGDVTFSEHLKSQRGVLLEAYEHQDYPFARLIDELQIKRDASSSTLVTTTFNFDRPVDVPTMHGLEARLLTQPISFADYDLSMNICEIGEELLLECDYNTDLFDSTTIERFLKHYQTLITGILSNPEQSLSQLPLLTAQQRQQILVDWNQTQVDYPQDKCIHQLFESQVEQNPYAVAVEFDGQKLTYQELNHRANQLAHYLQSLGVKPEVLVGIYLDRSVEMLVAMLGILKAGGAYLPLDPGYPQERLAHMLSDSQVPFLLTADHLQESLPSHSARTVCLDRDWTEISRHSDANPVSEIQPENLAYVIYTSGSTGKSKGVLIPHRGVVNHSHAIADNYQLTTSDRVLQFASFSFDVAAEEIFPTWSSGATLVLRPAEIPTILDFTKFIVREELTVLNLPVPYWQEWVNQMPEIGYQESCPECVRLLVLGSDKVPSERFTTWQKYVGKDISWRNAYGPTEATITATVYGPQLSSEAKNTSFLPIGRPIANTEVYILDRNLQPVPVGVKGELHIGGAGLAQGYLNRPELTAQKFISNPFNSVNNSDNNSKLYKSKLYKTGDLARYLPDGNIEFIGRIDRQVKIRGFRIELGEIETLLTQHPQVRESVVVANPDQNGDNRLTAYIVCDNAVLLQAESQKAESQQAENQKPTSSELRRCLKEKLPEYMVPSTFVTLESLPLMPNGKLDRNALRAAEALQQEQVTEEESKPIAPRSSTEEILSQIWAEILGRKRVGIHDNFFEMGGDSILSLQIVAKANQAGLQFTPKQIFQHQTIAELAAVVGSVPSIQAEQGLVSGPVALTPIQHWFFAENLPESHHYNQSVLLEVPQNLKAEPLKQAVEQLLLHHDALRLRYQFSGSSWEQINTTADKEVPFAVVDLSQVPLEQQKATIESTAAQIQATLNLSEGPIVRVALFHLGNNKPNRLLFVIHHLAVDGVSWRILLEDLFAAYQQTLQDNPVQFPPKTTSFQEWASLLNNYAQSETVSKELDYWLKPSYGDIPCLPTDSPNSLEANTVASRKEVLVELSLEKTQALLEKVPAVYNTQINDVLLAALGETFAYWTGNDKVLIDLEGHGREELFENVDLSRTVGWFTTVFPILLELQNTKNPGEVLKSIKEQIHSIPNRGIGYGILRYLSQDTTVRSQLEAVPQAEVSFNYLGKLDGSWLEYPGLTIAKESSGLTESPLGRRSHLLEIDGFVLDGKLQFNWKYSENTYRRATVEHLAQIFLEELESLIVHCLKSDVGGYTPSDFPEVDLDQQELDNLIDELTISEDSSFDFLEESGDLLDQQLDQQIDNLISQELKGF